MPHFQFVDIAEVGDVYVVGAFCSYEILRSVWSKYFPLLCVDIATAAVTAAIGQFVYGAKVVNIAVCIPIAALELLQRSGSRYWLCDVYPGY